MKKELKAWLIGMGVLVGAVGMSMGGLLAWKAWAPGNRWFTLEEIREEIDLNRLEETAVLLLSKEEVLHAIEDDWYVASIDPVTVDWLKEPWLEELGQTGYELLTSYFDQKGARWLAWDFCSQAKCISFIFRGEEDSEKMINLELHYIIGDEEWMVRRCGGGPFDKELSPVAPHWYEVISGES